MFGLFYGLFSLFGAGYENLRRHKENKAGKQRGFERVARGENPANIYFDWQGCEHDLATGKKVMTYRSHGHLFLKEVEGPVLRDLTQEEVMSERRERAANGEIAIKVIDDRNDCRNYKGIWDEYQRRTGKKDLNKLIEIDPSDAVYVHCKTGRYCIKRTIDFGRCYLKGLEKIKLLDNAIDRIYSYFVDIHSDEVLDKAPELAWEPTEIQRPLVNDENGQREMTIEEEQIGIQKYMELLKENKVALSKNCIGVKHILADVLPEYYDGI